MRGFIEPEAASVVPVSPLVILSHMSGPWGFAIILHEIYRLADASGG